MKFKVGDHVKLFLNGNRIVKSEGTGDVGYVLQTEGIFNAEKVPILLVHWTDTGKATKCHPKYLTKLTKLERALQ